VIKESFLPMRFLDPESQQFLSDYRFQRTNPFGKGESGHWERDEQMNVIRHDDIAANGNVVIFCARAKRTKDLVDLFASEKPKSRVCIEGNEIEWTHGGEEQFKPSWAFGKPAL